MNTAKESKVFGHAIRYMRNQAGLSQADLGERAGGLTHVAISRYERGKRQPDPSTLKAIAGALGATVDELRELEGQLRGAKSESEPEQDDALLGYVHSKSDISAWRDRVARDRGLEDRVHDVLMALPLFLDRTSWVVSVNADHFIEETGRSQELVDEYLPLAMASEYVERIGRVRYTARLTFPE